MSWRRHLLSIDWMAGAAVGLGMLALAGWLAELYRVPRGLLLAMGAVNLLYASFSFPLALRRERPRALVVALACANMAWGLVCAGLAVYWRDAASVFALLHFTFEAFLVGGLGWIEWRWRELLLVRP